ncbi:MAG: DUF4303 domain-containing protein [Lachnospiraceae bacterium]|nr:DUF4303 domain-containing protein [Lachnospiraceae bacterium]
MKHFFDEIRLEVYKAVKQDVKKILNQIGQEQIYGAALVTDSDCITLYFAVNTYEKMREKDLKYMNMFQAHLTEEKIEGLKNGALSMTKWVPAEWAYSGGKESELNNVSKLLYQKEEANSAEYEGNTALFFEAVTEAWRMLIADKILGEKTEDITYFVSMSDDNRSETIENYSASQLNRQELYEAFLKRAEERA